MPEFEVGVIAKTPNPQQVIYAAMHQDYTDRYVLETHEQWPSEAKCGEIIVSRLLAGGRGHYGPLEHPQITFTCGYFPHSVMQQARTHRVGVSFDVQSFRYTTDHILDVAQGHKEVEEVFYLRPIGEYSDRQGAKYFYSPELRDEDLRRCLDAAKHYAYSTNRGLSEEHARGMLPFDYRQHFVVSFNLRSLLHFCDLRFKKDAQLEIQQMCELMWPHVKEWCPAIAHWYETARLGKGKLAP